MLKKTVGNWVDGDRFFDRESDIAALREHVSQGTHTLLVAQRRMGKTSLVRELLRRLNGNPGVETAFVDLEDARDPADAIVIDMDHYEERLKMVLGTDGYRVALELLARAASEGSLSPSSIETYKLKLDISQDAGAAAVSFVLEVLVQDGYFTRQGEEFRFASGLLEDWQRSRKGLPIDPLVAI